MPEYEITGIEEIAGRIGIQVRFQGEVCCPHGSGVKLRLKDRRVRYPRHESWGVRNTYLELERKKWLWLECQRSFWRFPGIQPRARYQCGHCRGFGTVDNESDRASVGSSGQAVYPGWELVPGEQRGEA
jgi:hypothetical protein